MSLKFVGLHAHSDASIGDAIGKPKDHFDFVIKNAGEDSMAMAISEHGNCNSYGYVLQAYKDYKKKDIPFKPIYGVEAYYHPSLEEWKELKETKATKTNETDLVVENENESKTKIYNPLNRRHHLVLLAQNQEGLKNIYRLVSKSYRQGFYRYPRIDFRMLQEHNEGIIASTACVAGIPSFLVWQNKDDPQKAFEKELFPLMEIFGKDRFFLELQYNSLEEQMAVNNELIKFSLKTGYSLISTADSHYANPKWWQDRELYRLLARQSKGWKSDDDVLPQTIDELKCELYPKNGDQMFAEYAKMYEGRRTDALDQLIKESIERTYAIAHDHIEKIIPDDSLKLPKISGEKTPFQLLKNICKNEMERKGLLNNEIYINRLITELKTIKEKDFSVYFLTLHRAIDVLRKHILIGCGRGSGAGSLVAYLLGITQLDPIKNGLLFERFLASYREEAPDIDCDVEDRDIALEVLKKEFGEGNVLPVSNFNTLQLKSLVKDISRYYDIPFMEVNNVTTKMEDEARPGILQEIGGDQKLYSFNLEGAKKYSPTFREFLKEYPHIANHIEVLFGQNKSCGRHAGGLIICDNSESCMPIIRIRGTDQTPWSEGMAARHLEQFGLIKYDFLGLATLRFIRRCIELILKKQDKEPTIENVNDFYNNNLHPDVINPADEKVFERVYKTGDFPGIFQFTENGARNFSVRARPESVNDISALTAIFRPGPLHSKADQKYIDVRYGNINIDYEHPVLEEVLGETYGQLIYQEHFMILAHKLAGFGLDEADQLRKLLTKPITSLADDLKIKREETAEKFINGCVANGLTEERATRLWEDEIMGFVSYGFCKSHAMSYAYISYQCAWLFTYHEKEWIKAYLENDTDKDKAIADVSMLGYKIMKPDINQSGEDWTLDGKIVYPSLVSLKGIGDKAVKELIEIRKSVGGKFDNLDQLFYEDHIKKYKTKPDKKVKKWRYSKFTKRAFDALIQTEGFASLDIVGEGKTFQNYKHMHQIVIGDFAKVKAGKMEECMTYDFVPDWTNTEKIEMQKNILGTYDKELLFTKEVINLFHKYDIKPLSELNEYEQNIWFILKSYQTKKTSTGKLFYKLKIADVDDKIRTLNYFLKPQEELSRNAVYFGKLFIKGTWINTKYGSEIMKIS